MISDSLYINVTMHQNVNKDIKKDNDLLNTNCTIEAGVGLPRDLQ